jgi:hypothetical protein
LEILNLILGAIVAILTTILIEYVRKPKLFLTISPPVDIQYPHAPAKEVRFLGVVLHNAPMNRMFKWMLREAAQQCFGAVSFHHLDGQSVFGRSMQARWSGSPEPIATRFSIDGKEVAFVDGFRFTQLGKMDVFPGSGEKMDIAARFDNEAECYGWSNQNYFSDPVWRSPDWRLPAGRYLVKVTVVSSGEKLSKLFRLVNDVGRNDFRLEAALPSDFVTD